MRLCRQRFPRDMLNFMNSRSKFLELKRPRTFYNVNCVTLNSDDMVDPNAIEFSNVNSFPRLAGNAHLLRFGTGRNGATLDSTRPGGIEILHRVQAHQDNFDSNNLDGLNTFVCRIPKGE